MGSKSAVRKPSTMMAATMAQGQNGTEDILGLRSARPGHNAPKTHPIQTREAKKSQNESKSRVLNIGTIHQVNPYPYESLVTTASFPPSLYPIRLQTLRVHNPSFLYCFVSSPTRHHSLPSPRLSLPRPQSIPPLSPSSPSLNLLHRLSLWLLSPPPSTPFPL